MHACRQSYSDQEDAREAYTHIPISRTVQSDLIGSFFQQHYNG